MYSNLIKKYMYIFINNVVNFKQTKKSIYKIKKYKVFYIIAIIYYNHLNVFYIKIIIYL